MASFKIVHYHYRHFDILVYMYNVYDYTIQYIYSCSF